MDQLDSQLSDFYEILCFSKVFWENLSSFKTGQKWRVLYMKTTRHFWSYLAQFFWEWEMFHTNVAEKIKTHILCSVTLFFFENCAIYEIMWKNFAERGRPQMRVLRMRVACWIPKATNTYSDYVILIASPLQKLLHEHSSLLRFTYIADLFKYILLLVPRLLFFSRTLNLNILKPTGHVMRQQVYHSRIYVLPTLYLCVLYYLRTNSDLYHLYHKLIGFYKRDEKCLLRGTNWVFK